jgi:hypothetical protein
MALTLGGWSVLGIGSAVAIIAGIVLLVLYAVRRGLIHHELDALDSDTVLEGGLLTAGRVGNGSAPAASRTLGTAGALLLAVGLALGLAAAVAGWGDSGTTGAGPGAAPLDCAQSWSGCPQATPGS